jgi:5-(aminomethyl)-3-furanmethanol phosphate kinase
MHGAAVDIVVKVGGSLLAHPVHIAPVLEALDAAAVTARLLIVPGGGPFADAVRDVDRQFGLSEEAAHWMAILAMDQYAHFLAGRLRAASVVSGPADLASAYDRRELPVLAPSRWLRAADPLPHSWDVTSDSIAAWVTGAVGATRLVLVKPPGVASDAVDPYFHCALPAAVGSPTIVAADRTDMLRRCLPV